MFGNIQLQLESSWTTSATVGIALIGIGGALGFNLGMVAGAVISGVISEINFLMSDTTNLAPAMAGTDLFTHIRYMTLTTVPTYIITLIVFIILGLTVETTGIANTDVLLADIQKSFNISPWLFLVPVIVIGLIIKKTVAFDCFVSRNIVRWNFRFNISTQYCFNAFRRNGNDLRKWL